MVHERKVKETGDVLELRVSGQVRLGNLIMFDAQTDSSWLQETGEAISGQRQGQSLTPLKPEQWESQIRWDEWKTRHPDSKVLFCDHCANEGRH